MIIQSKNKKYVAFNIFSNKIIVNVNEVNHLFELYEADKMISEFKHLFNTTTLEYIKEYLTTNDKRIRFIEDSNNEQLSLF